MPCYPFECQCGFNEDVWATMSKMPTKRSCPLCGKQMNRVYTSPQINMHEAYTWANENGGRGRRIDSLMRNVTDDGDHLYKRSREELIETYKRAEVDFDVC